MSVPVVPWTVVSGTLKARRCQQVAGSTNQHGEWWTTPNGLFRFFVQWVNKDRDVPAEVWGNIVRDLDLREKMIN